MDLDEDTPSNNNDIEWELKYIKEFGNEKQLDILMKTVGLKN